MGKYSVFVGPLRAGNVAVATGLSQRGALEKMRELRRRGERRKLTAEVDDEYGIALFSMRDLAAIVGR